MESIFSDLKYAMLLSEVDHLRQEQKRWTTELQDKLVAARIKESEGTVEHLEKNCTCPL